MRLDIYCLSANIFLICSVEYDLGRSRARKKAFSNNRRKEEDRELTSTKSTIPDELSSNTECSRDTEENGVEVHLSQTVVGQQSSRVCVDIGPRVLSLSSL